MKEEQRGQDGAIWRRVRKRTLFGLPPHRHHRGHLHERPEIGGLLLVPWSARRYGFAFDQNRSQRFRSRSTWLFGARGSLYPFLLGITARQRVARSFVSNNAFVSDPLSATTTASLCSASWASACAMSDFLLGSAQDQLDRVPEPVAAAVDLGAEPALDATQGLLALADVAFPYFFEPAARGRARSAVESRISTHRLLPSSSRSGTSAHAAPVWANQRTASRHRPMSRAAPPYWPGRPGRRCSMKQESVSEIAW